MLRRQYQEKFLKKELEKAEKAEKLKHIEKEVDEVFYLFEELYQTVQASEKDVNIIQDNIEQTKTKVNQTEKEIIQSQEQMIEIENNYNYLRYILAGGIGSVGFVFNTYVGIGSIIGGCMFASLYSILQI